MGSTSPDKGLEVAIERDAVVPFGIDPLNTFTGEYVCATGVVQDLDGTLRIYVSGLQEVVVYTEAPDAVAPGGACEEPVSWEQALDYAGERAPVQGPVVGWRVDTETNPEELHIVEIGRPYPEPGGVDIAFAEGVLEDFNPPPAEQYAGETICVDGFVSEVEGRARLFAAIPAGVFVVE
jgi:hypothetical protein